MEYFSRRGAGGGVLGWLGMPPPSAGELVEGLGPDERLRGK